MTGSGIRQMATPLQAKFEKCRTSARRYFVFPPLFALWPRGGNPYHDAVSRAPRTRHRMQLVDRIVAPLRRPAGGVQGLAAAAPSIATVVLAILIAAQLAALVWRALGSGGDATSPKSRTSRRPRRRSTLPAIVNAHLFGVAPNSGDPSDAPATVGEPHADRARSPAASRNTAGPSSARAGKRRASTRPAPRCRAARSSSRSTRIASSSTATARTSR